MLEARNQLPFPPSSTAAPLSLNYLPYGLLTSPWPQIFFLLATQWVQLQNEGLKVGSLAVLEHGGWEKGGEVAHCQ